ncbi:MAG: LysR family transcriptional regulator [Candidatus Binatia bacterium]|nr:LysR family transcriptional regulator [Candidatus Binatia bacterium]
MRLDQVDLNKLQVFYSVVEEGGVSGAGRALGRTPSAVSQSISALEAFLGQKLFDRTGQRMILTRGGQVLHERFGVYQRALARVVAEIANEEGEVRGTVRIGLFLGAPRKRFAAFVSSFTRAHPAAGIRVFYGSADDLATRLANNKLDFAFSFRPSGVLPGIDATRLFERELILVSGKKYFAKGFDRAELEQVPIVDYYQGDPLIERWCRRHLGATAPRLDVKMWAATTDLVLDLVLENAGAAVLPTDLVAEHLRRGRLRLLRPGRKRLVDYLWLLEPAGAFRDVTQAAFHAAVVEAFADSDGEIG